MQINIYNTTVRPHIDRRSIRKLVRKVLREENKDIPTVNIVIADGTYMKHLNEIYLNKKRTTNVIAFDMGEVSEIYISNDMARDPYDLKYFILHGLLHLLGYDHDSKQNSAEMNRKCAGYLDNE